MLVEEKRWNILFIMPRISYYYDEWPCPPVGIAYVSSYLKHAGICNVYTVNMNLEEDSLESVLKHYISHYHIDVVASGELVVNWEKIKQITDIVKKLNPEVITVIGGGLVTHTPWEAMELIPTADIGVIGEGEVTEKELMEALICQKSLAEVDGLIFRRDKSNQECHKDWQSYKQDFVIAEKFWKEVNEKYVITPPREEIADLDSIPWPDYEGFRFFDMFAEDAVVRRALITTSRSCPYRCTFCSHSGGKKYRQRSLDSVFEEMEYLMKNYNIGHFFLNDELFANNQERIVEFCSRIKAYNITWICFLRVNKYVTQELVNRMADCGCKEIFYGLESGDNRILKSMNKGTTVEEVERVLKVTRSAGIAARGNFIFGDPEETMETVENTMEWVYQHKQLLGSVVLGPIQLFPGSKLYIDAVKNGKIEDSREFVRNYCPITNVSKLSDKEYGRLVNEIIPENLRKINEVNLEIYYSGCDKDKRVYYFEVVCPDCGKRNKIAVNPIGLSTNILFQCTGCEFSYELNVFKAYMAFVEEKLHNFICSYKAGIWGIGKIWYTAYLYSQYMKTDQYCLIDSSSIRQQEDFQGRAVFAPADIPDLGIDTILCTVHRTTDIEIMIQEKYPQIKKFVWLYDFALDYMDEK